MSSVGRGGQIRLMVTFHEFSGGNTYDPDLTDDPKLEIYFGPTLRLGPLLYSDGATQLIRDSTGVYSYVWTVPNDEPLGEHLVKWSGTIHGTMTYGQETVSVIASGSASAGSDSPGLTEDYFITFLAELDPMYIDVSEVQGNFPEASAVEIAEQIHIASVEVDMYFPDLPVPPLIAIEYVKAATNCALSRVYEYGFGGEELSVKLGDLSVSTRPMGNKTVSRGTASSWCELAAALREEMLLDSGVGNRAGMKAANKGSAFLNPMPIRVIRRHD